MSSILRLISRYKSEKQAEKQRQAQLTQDGYHVRPHSTPFILRWIAGLTDESK